MFQDPRDARDAVRALDGKYVVLLLSHVLQLTNQSSFPLFARLICGRRVRVELSSGKSRHDKSPRGFGGDRGDRGRDMRGSRGSYGSPPPRDRGMSRREPFRGPERRYDDRSGGYSGRHARAYSR